MVFRVHRPFEGHAIGDDLTAQQAHDFRNAGFADYITAYPEEARARLEMRDVTPSKPVGMAPSHADALEQEHPMHSTGAGALSETAPVYLGQSGAADGSIAQPSLDERLRDANPHHQVPLPTESSVVGVPDAAIEVEKFEAVPPVETIDAAHKDG